mmetsp:Transcript_90941/g.253989  ORF Transcript_90941/g.253989 Transcript_90941/m.253989 type:complete len:212 (+) Transcript_90941:3055-3690(+)
MRGHGVQPEEVPVQPLGGRRGRDRGEPGHRVPQLQEGQGLRAAHPPAHGGAHRRADHGEAEAERTHRPVPGPLRRGHERVRRGLREALAGGRPLQGLRGEGQGGSHRRAHDRQQHHRLPRQHRAGAEPGSGSRHLRAEKGPRSPPRGARLGPRARLRHPAVRRAARRAGVRPGRRARGRGRRGGEERVCPAGRRGHLLGPHQRSQCGGEGH